MSTIPVTQSDANGETITWQSAWVGGDQFSNNGRTVLLYRNTVGSTVATIDSPALIDGLTIENPAVTIGAGMYKTIGPFDPAIFNTVGTGGLVLITYSGAGLNTTEVAAISA